MIWQMPSNHPGVSFNTVEDDTITALKKLRAIFKRKYNKTPALDLIDSPTKAAENKHPAVLIQPVLTSPIKHTSQTRSQTEVNKVPANVSESQYSSQLFLIGHYEYKYFVSFVLQFL
jgi:hypothetical protein